MRRPTPAAQMSATMREVSAEADMTAALEQKKTKKIERCRKNSQSKRDAGGNFSARREKMTVPRAARPPTVRTFASPTAFSIAKEPQLPFTTMEVFFERLMYAARWLLAPIYIGLSAALLALAIKFFQEVFHILPHVLELAEADLILGILSLIDMGLVGGLIVMVMFSGYENFVSALNIGEHTEKLDWLGKMDAGSLKNKVAASIVAISSIHLLRVFMELQTIPDSKLLWYVVIHLTFVLSAVVMAKIDLMHKEAH